MAPTFLPIDFSLSSSKKSQVNGVAENIDNRSYSWKSRKEALQTTPKQIPGMSTGYKVGIHASMCL